MLKFLKNTIFFVLFEQDQHLFFRSAMPMLSQAGGHHRLTFPKMAIQIESDTRKYFLCNFSQFYIFS